MPDTWQLQQGDTARWRVLLRDAGGKPLPGVYSGTEALTLRVWPGDDRAPATLVDSTVAWESAATGTLLVTIGATDSAALAVGWWRVDVDLADAGRRNVLSALLEIQPQPGTATAGPVYGTLDDARRAAPWIDRLITEQPTMQADLRDYLSAARRRLDDAILARYRPLGRTGWDAQLYRLDEPFASWYPATDGTDQYLRDQLAANRLMLSGGRGEIVREITARIAVAMLCESQLAAVGDDTSNYQATAGRYARQAAALMAGYIAEIDTNGDGTADIRVPLGVASSR